MRGFVEIVAENESILGRAIEFAAQLTGTGAMDASDPGRPNDTAVKENAPEPSIQCDF